MDDGYILSTQLKTAPNPLDAAIGMRLAFWSYPYKDEEAAKKVTTYPDSWEHARPGKHLPAGFQDAIRDASGKITQEGWNTQHNANGTLENQFKVSINETTHQISFDFKGSDVVSNFKSDLGNAGASEFGKIQTQAQKALEALQADERYKGYNFAATGHSLGGGMAQSFALRNNLDAYVYNSLPIARDTLKGDYFKPVGGAEVALARYQVSDHHVHDVRTPNDIATFTYEGVMQNQYLSHHVGPGPQVLPGPQVPNLLKAALVASEVGTAPALAIMAKDHTMGALLAAQHGLGIKADVGAYRIPEGQLDFANIPAHIRRQFALLDHSPVTKVFQSERGAAHDGATSAYDRFHIEREDGSKQTVSVHQPSGEVEINHQHPDGRRTVLAMNGRHPGQAQLTEFDAQGRQLSTQSSPLARADTLKAPEITAATLTPAQQNQLEHFKTRLGDRLQAQGYSPQQIDTLAAAALAQGSRDATKGEGQPVDYLMSKTGDRLMLKYPGEFRYGEIGVQQALETPAALHLAQAKTQAQEPTQTQTQTHAQAQLETAPELAVRQYA